MSNEKKVMQKEIKNFNDLEAWQKAHELTLDIYKITAGFPKRGAFWANKPIKKSG